MKYYLKKYKGLLAFTIFLATIASIAFVGIAFILQRILDVAVSGDTDGFSRVLIISVVYFVILTLITYVYSYFYYKFIYKIINAVRERVFNGIINRNYADFNSVNTADYISALTNDVKLVEENYLIPLLDIIQMSVMFIGSLIVMFYFDLIVAISVVGAILLMFIVPSVFGAIIQKKQDRFSKKLSEFTSSLKDILSGFETIKSYSMKPYVISKFNEKNKTTTNAGFNVGKVTAANESASTFFAIFIQVLVIFLSAYFIIIGRITVGAMIAMIQVSGMLIHPLMLIFDSAPKIKGVKTIINRLNKLSEYNDNSFIGTKTPTYKKGIYTKNLSFSYKEGKPILKDITLEIKKGKRYAIVGKNGCGKSTLVKLICGYYSNYEGEIKYDERELMELNYDKLITLSATIHQNVYMFNESIYDNICLHSKYSNLELAEALDASGSIGFIEELPEGIHTMVDENGKNFSGGQKQRIAVARAIIQGKPILVLDEGTSAIDMQTAYDIESRLLKMKDLTLITITHNLAEDNLKRYDQIIFMDNGKVKEVGTFKELMKNQGGFYKFSKMKKLK